MSSLPPRRAGAAHRVAPAPTGHAVIDLIAQARTGLAEAAVAVVPADRYVDAHLAALRAAAAVLAAKARPRAARGPRSVWALLPQVAPQLTEWAAFFAASAGKRAAAEAGLPRAVTPRDADDLLRQSEAFLAVVCGVIGMPHQEPLRGAVAALRAG